MNRIKKISIVLVVLVFTLDLLIPLGIAIGALYMFCILLVNKSDNRFIFYLTSIICTLILFKLLIYMNEDTYWMTYLNRFTSVAIIIGSAFFVSKFNNDIDKGNESLNQHVEKLKSLDNIIENLIEGAQVIGYDWKYLYVNNSLCKQVNLSKIDLVGKTIMEMYPGIENSILFKELKASMEDRNPKILQNEFEFPNGEVEFFELNIQPVEEGLFILSLVITDRVKIENQRLKYIQNLEEMLQMTSHQIRQPITNILGLTNLMKIGPNLSEEEKTQINYIKDSAIKLDEFTYNLNDFIVNSIKHNEVKLNKEIETSA